MLLIKRDAILRLFLCLLTFLASAPVSAENPAACLDVLSDRQYDETASVQYVHDGDTLKLSDGRTIRLIGINAPELARDGKQAEAYSSEAKNTLGHLFKKGNTISLVYGADKKDRYGRILAHIYSADNQNAQASLLNKGHAFAISFPPNTQLAACYHALEHQARCNRKGLWKDTAIVNTSELDNSHSGVHLVRGNVESISINKKGLWINLDNRLTVGIRSDNQKLFDKKLINNLLKQSIIVRGWLNKSEKSNPFYMRIRHPLAIQTASSYTCG